MFSHNRQLSPLTSESSGNYRLAHTQKTKENSHTHTNMQTVVMTAAVPEPDWMADTSPALQISSGGNHSNNAITIPVTKLASL